MLQVKQTVHFTDPPHSIIVDSVKLLSGNGPSGAKDIEDGEVVVGSSGDSSEESGSKSDTSDMVTEEGTDCRGEEDDDSSSPKLSRSSFSWSLQTTAKPGVRLLPRISSAM